MNYNLRKKRKTIKVDDLDNVFYYVNSKINVVKYRIDLHNSGKRNYDIDTLETELGSLETIKNKLNSIIYK